MRQHKVFLLLIGFLWIPSLLVSQDWSPVVVDRIAHYALGVGGPLSQSIWVDSSTNDLNGQTHHLNRVSKTINPETDIRFGDGTMVNRISGQFGLMNRGQFLQEKVEKVGIRRWRFIGETEYYIDLDSSNFFFGTEDQLSASLSNPRAANVLGEPDSLRTVSLSNGTSIELSKEHGIIKFPASFDSAIYYHLNGFQDDPSNFSLGYFMDWHEGDFFRTTNGTTTNGWDHSISQFDYWIMNRKLSNGMISFELYYHRYECYSCSTAFQFNDTIWESGTYETSPTAFNDSLLLINGFTIDRRIWTDMIRNVFKGGAMGYGFGSAGPIVYSTFKGLNPPPPQILLWFQDLSSPPKGDTVFSGPEIFGYSDPAILLKQVNIHRFETNSSFEFSHYKIGDKLYNVEVGTDKFPEQRRLNSVYPNPVKGKLQLPLTLRGQPRVFDVSGKEINLAYNEVENSLNTESLPPGLYLLIGGDQTFRFIKE